MRKNSFRHIGFTLALLFTFYIPVQAVFAVPDKLVLKRDMHGDQIAQLQNDLKKLGFFCQEPTGYYGDATEAAVFKFQKENGLAADGMVGDSTFNKISSLLAAKAGPILKKGMTSPGVTAIQRCLKQLGFFPPALTGYYGDATEAAVMKFQKRTGIAPDGIVGAKTHEKIDALLKNLKPVLIVIDPGHGGIDVGTSKGNVVESDITLSISKKLQDCLTDYGYSAVLTRKKDIALDSLSDNGDTRQERDLNARTNIINKSGAEFFVSIHVDSRPESPSTTGSSVYYNNKISGSRELARNIQEALNNVKAGSLKRQPHDCEQADYYILRNSHVPGVLVETAFITNSKERKLLVSDSFGYKLAKAILEGIEKTRYE